MIVCPNCKEEIDEQSYYCDQCGQKLFYCERCGRVGIGRRCTSCGGLMSVPGEKSEVSEYQVDDSVSTGFVSQVSNTKSNPSAPRHRNAATPQLLLFNDSLGIRITGINGAIIGRRQGPYSQMLQGQGYISGAHAQLKYAHATGWSIADKHSSNGTRLNDHQLQPDVEMSLKNGDILSLANVPLKVSIC